jgi:hypothetical protein
VSLLLKHFKRIRRQLKTKKSVRRLYRRKRLLLRDNVRGWSRQGKNRSSGGLVEREVQIGDRQGNRMSKIDISR